MKKKVLCLVSIALMWLGACQPEQVPPAAALPKPITSAAAQRLTTEADAERMGNHLMQRLRLTPRQAQKISQLTLAQAREEQILWTRLADTARQQLHTIALQYDGQMQLLLTASQYRQFAQLRQADRRRRRAQTQATAEVRLRR